MYMAMTNEQVDEMEGSLREAERQLENAAQKMCDEPQDSEDKRALWKLLNDALGSVRDVWNFIDALRPYPDAK